MAVIVSIIVPVYNAEKTLQRCLNSVLGQEYRDFELIVVDDGSRDSSPAILDAYAASDERVQVIHKENSGVSDSRNLALDRAQGKYLQFLDSDDWITPDATRLLVQAAEENNCDLVISDFYRVVGTRLSSKGDIDEDQVLSREEYAAHMMENPADFYYGVLWNKLYRRDIVETYHLRMDPEISWCEDFMFNLEYIRRAERFLALQVPIYYYVKTKGSLANQNLNISQTLRMKLMVFEYYHNFYKSVLDEEEYEKCRLKVYKFLIDAARDGAVPPLLLPGASRLGGERTTVSAEVLESDGLLQSTFRERMLLQYYLEPVTLKYNITIPEARLLLYLAQAETVGTRQELAELTGLSSRNLTLTLKKLESRKLIDLEEVKDPETKEKKLALMFLPEAEALLEDLTRAEADCEKVRLTGFTEEELEQYRTLSAKIKANLRNALKRTAEAKHGTTDPIQ